ncbi:hypothetical protein COC43_03245 [Bacillus thuringiensis]|uniref:Kiwa anti-phage protein KwaB-like domain-containing protein n=1 Tax=Bacillus thuringiensis TaxID=1428 RepID=UPI000BFDD57B|nr:Kiwa anti-phage protein KwaB-like domain-containing protein [Bacillus thuringiensis]PGR82054.1 hypothetical protein COC43_03245 [Bacillus thuringiensis]
MSNEGLSMLENKLTKQVDEFFNAQITDTKIYLIFRNIDDETSEYLYSSSYFGFHKKDYQNFKDEYKDYLLKLVENKELTAYDISVTEKGAIEFISTSAVPNIDKVKKVLTPSESDTIANDTDLNPVNIWGYSVVMQNSNGNIMRTYRKQVNAKLMKESKVLNFSQGEVKIIDQADRLILDFKIDAIEFDDECYVTNSYYFNQFFSYTEAHVNFAKENFDALEELAIIDNFNDFHARCLQSVTLVKRLVSVIKEDRLHWLQENFDAAKQVAIDYELKIEFDKDTDKINYSHTKCNITDVITLIRGGCVKDAVDMERYIASSVRKVGSSAK